MSYAIAIDGPSGAGKSTIAKRVAKELSFIYVDTGAMYRAMALYVLEQNIDPQDQAKVAAACPDIDVTILYEDGVQQVLLNGKNVSAEIRQEIVGNTASRISVIKEVREKLVALQRQLAAKENVVMDGRDIGTQVLPDATVKIYLTASAKERAKRRYLELQEKVHYFYRVELFFPHDAFRCFLVFLCRETCPILIKRHISAKDDR